MGLVKKTIARRFLGKTEGFENTIERAFYQRMLKAYLKGAEYFHFGFRDIQEAGFTRRQAKLVKVAQRIYEV